MKHEEMIKIKMLEQDNRVMAGWKSLHRFEEASSSLREANPWSDPMLDHPNRLRRLETKLSTSKSP